MKKIISLFVGSLLLTVMTVTGASAQTLKCQTVISAKAEKDFADIAVPFWSGSQMSNAKLGMAHAATLK